MQGINSGAEIHAHALAMVVLPALVAVKKPND
jgi:hypothetical protein